MPLVKPFTQIKKVISLIILPDILDRLNINPDTWLDEMKSFRTDGITAVGTVSQLKDFCKSLKKKWSVGFIQVPLLEYSKKSLLLITQIQYHINLIKNLNNMKCPVLFCFVYPTKI